MKKVILILVVVLVSIVVVRNIIVKFSLEQGIRKITGLQLSISNLDIGLTKSIISLKGVKVYNPPGFEDKLMFHVPEVFVDYNLGDILKGKKNFDEIRLAVEEFNVLRNEKGELNLDSLKALQDLKSKSKGADPTPPPQKPSGEPLFEIKKLSLNIGTVRYKDFSRNPPAVQEHVLNIKEEYTNINDPKKLVGLVVMRALSKTNIAQLANFNLEFLSGTLSSTLTDVQKIGEGVITGATGILEKTLNVFPLKKETNEE